MGAYFNYVSDLKSLIEEIDDRLAMIEDYAKGEVGREVTKLRGEIREKLKKIEEE